MDAVEVLLRVQRSRSTRQRPPWRRSRRPRPARPTRPAVLAMLTIALGADARSSGSSASVSRSCASKFSAIVRRASSAPVSANVPRPPAPALLTSRSRRPPWCSSRWRGRARARPRRAGRGRARSPRRAATPRALQPLRPARDEHEREPGLPGEPARGGLAQPAGGSGDQRDGHGAAILRRRTRLPVGGFADGQANRRPRRLRARPVRGGAGRPRRARRVAAGDRHRAVLVRRHGGRPAGQLGRPVAAPASRGRLPFVVARRDVQPRVGRPRPRGARRCRRDGGAAVPDAGAGRRRSLARGARDRGGGHRRPRDARRASGPRAAADPARARRAGHAEPRGVRRRRALPRAPRRRRAADERQPAGALGRPDRAAARPARAPLQPAGRGSAGALPRAAQPRPPGVRLALVGGRGGRLGAVGARLRDAAHRARRRRAASSPVARPARVLRGAAARADPLDARRPRRRGGRAHRHPRADRGAGGGRGGRDARVPARQLLARAPARRRRLALAPAQGPRRGGQRGRPAPAPGRADPPTRRTAGPGSGPPISSKSVMPGRAASRPCSSCAPCR